MRNKYKVLAEKYNIILEANQTPKEVENAVIKDYQDGVPIMDIMGRNSIGSKTIYDILARNGLKKQNRSLDIPEKVRQQIIDLVRQRLTDQQIVDKLIAIHPNMTSALVRHVAADARKLDPTIPLRGEATPEQINKIMELAKEMSEVGRVKCFKYSTDYIGKIINMVNPDSINNIIKKNNPNLYKLRYNTPKLNMDGKLIPAASALRASPEKIKKILELATEMDNVNDIDCFAYSAKYIGNAVGIKSPKNVNIIIKKYNPELYKLRYNTPVVNTAGVVKSATSSRGYVRKNSIGTRQQKFGDLGTNDPAYRAVMARAQNITGDQDYQVQS